MVNVFAIDVAIKNKQPNLSHSSHSFHLSPENLDDFLITNIIEKIILTDTVLIVFRKERFC